MNLQKKYFLLVPACTLFFFGCEKGEIKTYTIEKEAPQALPEIVEQPPAAPPSQATALTWQVPENWIEKPATQFRKGSFDIPVEGASPIDVSIISFPGEAGGLLANINRWRTQAGLSPAATLEESGIEPLSIAGIDGYFVELLLGDPTKAIIGAVIPLPNETWFLKATAPAEILSAKKPELLQFLGSFQK